MDGATIPDEANPSSTWSSSSSSIFEVLVMDLDLLIESPELKLEQRFLIFRHFRARVPFPFVKSGAGASFKGNGSNT